MTTESSFASIQQKSLFWKTIPLFAPRKTLEIRTDGVIKLSQKFSQTIME
jgi:hypothetical protein